MQGKKLYRSSRDSMICGVCGGISEYFEIDSTIVRLIVAVLLLSGTGFLAYFVATIIIPKNPYQ